MSDKDRYSFSVDQRVKRTEGGRSHGSVVQIREEVNTSALESARERNYLVQVRWDNGTLSFVSPESIETI